jgi:hypothetical protein
MRIAPIVAAGIVLVLAYTVAGTGGLAVAATGTTIAALLILRAGIAHDPPPPRRARERQPDEEGPFTSYRQIRRALTWTGTSRRHYDHAVRPLLTRLLAAVLAERHGIDLHRSPQQARSLVGEDLWPLLDPAGPASSDSGSPGVDRGTLTRIVDRLEEL